MKLSLGKIRKAVGLGGVLTIMLAQSAAFALIGTTSVAAAGSAKPNGPIKTFIITYDSLPGEPTKADTIPQKRAKYYWQKNRVMTDLSRTKGYKRVVRNMTEMPVSIVQVDAEGEASLRANKRIKRIEQDRFLKPAMNEAIPLLGGTVANGFSDGSNNFTGDGNTIVVIDSGFNTNHLMLSGSAVSEACYSLSGTYSDVILTSACPGGADSSTAAGSSVESDCTGTITTSFCGHGTSVASTAAGRAVNAGGNNYSGSAKDAKLVLIKVSFKIQEIAGQADFCGDGSGTVSSCFSMSMAGVVSGINRAIQLQNDGALDDPIASVNMSLGSATVAHADTASCDAASGAGPLLTAFQALRQMNIAPVVAAGNFGNTNAGNGQTTYAGNANKLSYPSCLTNAVAVSASAKDDTPSYYTQAGARTDIFAPGGDQLNNDDLGLVTASGPNNNSLGAAQGTSLASPIVAGAWAVMREKNPTATTGTVLRIMKETATNLTDNRTGYTTTAQKRLVLDDALAALTGKPAITSVTPPSGTPKQGDQVDIQVAVTNATSCAVGNNSVSASGGSATINLTAASGSQSYTVICSDASGYAAQSTVGFVAGAATNNPFPSNPSAGSDGEILLSKNLGVPNTGIAGILKSSPLVTLVVTMITALIIVVIAKRYSAANR